jgi:hypothetical protein
MRELRWCQQYRAPQAGDVDELDAAAAMLRPPVRENPQVGADAGAEEDLRGQGDDGFDQIILQQPAADFGFARAGPAVEQRRAGQHDHRAAAAFVRQFQLAGQVQQKEHGAVVDARQAGAEAAAAAHLPVLGLD